MDAAQHTFMARMKHCLAADEEVHSWCSNPAVITSSYYNQSDMCYYPRLEFNHHLVTTLVHFWNFHLLLKRLLKHGHLAPFFYLDFTILVLSLSFPPRIRKEETRIGKKTSHVLVLSEPFTDCSINYLPFNWPQKAGELA